MQPFLSSSRAVHAQHPCRDGRCLAIGRSRIPFLENPLTFTGEVRTVLCPSYAELGNSASRRILFQCHPFLTLTSIGPRNVSTKATSVPAAHCRLKRRVPCGRLQPAINFGKANTTVEQTNNFSAPGPCAIASLTGQRVAALEIAGNYSMSCGHFGESA